MARLAHRGEKEAVVALPETWLEEARQAKATVRLWSDGDRRFQARLRELSPQADSATRTYAARFTILDADDSVAFGMTATVTLERAREAPVARLPLSAVLNRGTGPSVYVVDNGGALALAAGDGRRLHGGRRAGDVRRQGRRHRRYARRAEARSRPQGAPTHRPQLVSQSRGSDNMKRFNLSEWAITHRALVLFMILLIGAAGLFSYFKLGRAEDPSFTIKVMTIQVAWPGATAAELQAQVVDKIEKKLQDLPHLDRVESYSQPGVAFVRVNLSDTTPPRKVKELWYQARKKVGDIRGDLPAGIIGPNFNDEFGDVYSALYMMTADGMGLAELKKVAEDIRQRLLRVPAVNKVDLIGVQPEKIFIEFSHAKLATLGITPQQIFDSVARQNAVIAGGSVDTTADRIHLRVTGAFSGADAIAAVPVQVGRPGVPARRHRDGQARL